MCINEKLGNSAGIVLLLAWEGQLQACVNKEKNHAHSQQIREYCRDIVHQLET